jgi:DNA-binding IclR family transcriptional regulator
LTELLKQLPLPRITAATITDRAALLTDLEYGRKQGYCVTVGENVADVIAVAATVRLGSDVYGIAIAGPRHRMTDNLTRHVSALRAACTAIIEMMLERTAVQRRG